MMGLEEDPEDHKAVAASIFIAVAVYGVWPAPELFNLLLIRSRAFWYSAVHRHIFTYGQVVEGLSPCDDDPTVSRIDALIGRRRWVKLASDGQTPDRRS